MSHKRAALRLIFTLTLLAPAASRAAGDITGKITGYVFDPGGAPAVGFALTIHGPALQQSQTRKVDADGRYEFDALPPGGDYFIAGESAKYAPVKEGPLTVQLGEATSDDIVLAFLGQEVTVTAAAPTAPPPKIDRETAKTATVVNAERATEMPMFHQVEAMPQQTAGVGPGNRPSTFGGLSRWGKFYVDGMDTTDITDGSITAPMNFDSVENFEIVTGGFDAQYNALGMVESAVTKTGSNRWTYDASLTLSPTFAAAKNLHPSSNPSFVKNFVSSKLQLPQTSFYSPELNVGGPIIKDKLWFFASGQANFSNKDNPLTLPTGFQERNTDTQTRLARIKLTWQPEASDRLSLAFNYDHNAILNDINNANTAQSAERNLDRGGYFVIANYLHYFTQDLRLVVQTGVTSKDVNEDPADPTLDASGNPLPSHTDIFSGSFTTDNAGRISASEQGNFLHESKTRFQFDPTVQWTLGAHDLKGGVQVSVMRDQQTDGVNNGVRFLDKNGFCDISSGSRDGTSACYEMITVSPGALTTNAQALNLGAFVQDTWTVNRRLTVVPGLRIDTGRLYGDQGLVTTPLTGLGPRLAATFDPIGDHKGLVLFHYGRSNDVGNVLIAQHANHALTQYVSTFGKMGFPDCVSNPSQPGCSVAGGPSGNSFLDHQTPPTVDDLGFGYRHSAFDTASVGTDVTLRRYSNMWEDQEVNRVWDNSGTKIVGYADGTAHTIYKTQATSLAWRDYVGVDVWAEGKIGNFDLLANYTLAYNWGTAGDYFDGLLINPRMTQFYQGYLDQDHRHTFKGSLAYHAGYGIDISLRFEYDTGSPFWESFPNPADGSRFYRSPRGTGFANDPTSQTPNFFDNSTWAYMSNPDYFDIDLQVRYNLGAALHTQAKMELVGLLVNALNASGAVSLQDYWSDTNNKFGTAFSYRSPLQAELMLRVRN